jgi:sugar lactone lactonase YvrE
MCLVDVQSIKEQEMNVRCLYDGKFMLSESPLWCERTHSLWWVNMVGPSAVYRLPWGQEEPEIFPSSVPVTSIAFSEDNNLLIIRNYPSGADMPKSARRWVVEPDGIEPTTSTMPL